MHRPTGCALGQTGSGRPGSLQSASSTWQGHSAWRRSPLPSTEAGNSSLYRQLRLRAYSGRSAPAGVTAIAPIGLRTSTRGPRGTGYPVLKEGSRKQVIQARLASRMKLSDYGHFWFDSLKIADFNSRIRNPDSRIPSFSSLVSMARKPAS